MPELLKILSGSWKAKRAGTLSRDVCKAMPRIKELWKGLPAERRSDEYMKELIPALCSNGYLSRLRMQVGPAFKPRINFAYRLTPLGKEVVNGKRELLMRVPVAIRQLESEQVKQHLEFQADASHMALEVEDVQTLTVPELKAALKQRGISGTCGRKAELQGRLVKALQPGMDRARCIHRITEQIQTLPDAVLSHLAALPAEAFTQRFSTV